MDMWIGRRVSGMCIERRICMHAGMRKDMQADTHADMYGDMCINTGANTHTDTHKERCRHVQTHAMNICTGYE